MKKRYLTGLLLLGFLLVTAKGNAQEDQKDIELNTSLMETTFKLEGRNTQGQPTIGTVFIMGRPYPQPPNQTSNQTPNERIRVRYVLITAAHVLEEMQGETAILYLRRKVDAANWVRTPYPLHIRANGQPLWKRHPDADVAVMYLGLPIPDLMVLTTELLADDKMLSDFEIHPGDEMQCLGYPFGLEANEAGFAVLRSGKVASYPLLPTNKTKTFLFDFRVFKGNSGGPVYFVQSNRTYKGGLRVGTIHFIVGLVSQESLMSQQISGPYSEETRQFQLDLAIVVHASLIKQAVNMLPSPETLPD